MRVKFWGVRGSIPTPLTKEELVLKLYKALELYNESEYYHNKDIKNFLKNTPFYVQRTYGGNTSCVEINCDNEIIILDAGSGIRTLGNEIAKQQTNNPYIHLFISHTHWDHIMGYPFFTPNFIKDKKIRIYAPIPDIKERFEQQQDYKFFPVALDNVFADIQFVILEENKPYIINNNITVNNLKLNHPGDSYAYSIIQKNKKVVYATDNEIYGSPKEFIHQYKDFVKDADVFIFDAQYTLKETLNRITWGHSSSTMGVEIALEANCKNLILFHFEPGHTDADIYNNQTTTEKYFHTIKKAFDTTTNKNFKIFSAYEGLTFDL